jgi:hypothetical protein
MMMSENILFSLSFMYHKFTYLNVQFSLLFL